MGLNLHLCKFQKKRSKNRCCLSCAEVPVEPSINWLLLRFCVSASLKKKKDTRVWMCVLLFRSHKGQATSRTADPCAARIKAGIILHFFSIIPLLLSTHQKVNREDLCRHSLKQSSRFTTSSVFSRSFLTLKASTSRVWLPALLPRLNSGSKRSCSLFSAS